MPMAMLLVSIRPIAGSIGSSLAGWQLAV